MTRVPFGSGAGSPRGPDRIAAVTKLGADFISEPKVPGEHKWVELADDRRTSRSTVDRSLEPVRTLSRQGWDAFELLHRAGPRRRPRGGRRRGRVHLVAGLPVDEAAAVIVDDVGSGRLVALGGGRVIDSAKAASATGVEVAAIPTTLSVRRSPASTACLRPRRKRPASSGRLWSWPTPTP